MKRTTWAILLAFIALATNTGADTCTGYLSDYLCPHYDGQQYGCEAHYVLYWDQYFNPIFYNCYYHDGLCDPLNDTCTEVTTTTTTSTSSTSTVTSSTTTTTLDYCVGGLTGWYCSHYDYDKTGCESTFVLIDGDYYQCVYDIETGWCDYSDYSCGSAPTTTTTTTTTTVTGETTTTSETTTTTTIPATCSIIGCGQSCMDNCVEQYYDEECTLQGAISCINSCPRCEECTGYMSSGGFSCEALDEYSCNLHYDNYNNVCTQCVWSGIQCYITPPAYECACPHEYVLAPCSATLVGECSEKNQSECANYHDYWPMQCEWLNDTCVPGDECDALCTGSPAPSLEGCNTYDSNETICENFYDDDLWQCKWYGEVCGGGYPCYLSTTTTTSTTTTFTVPTIPPNASITNWNPVVNETNCSNYTKMQREGDYASQAMCAYSHGVGTPWVMGFLLLFVCGSVYKSTRSYGAVVVAGVLVLAATVEYLPLIYRIWGGAILAVLLTLAILPHIPKGRGMPAWKRGGGEGEQGGF
jgi:hypothetical protein